MLQSDLQKISAGPCLPGHKFRAALQHKGCVLLKLRMLLMGIFSWKSLL